ncbi:MAG: methylamine utilization protein [Planctomycetes bacterium]|nr:methylamine utilization protein [Planctomycetota bacterium]
MRRAAIPCAVGALAALLLAATATQERERLGPLTRSRAVKLTRPDAPPPDPTNRVADDPRAARLGQFLFFDTRLSSTGKVSCATCHDPALAFADGKSLSEGVGRAGRNAPTALDAAHARWLFWDGRADSLWSQAVGPLENDDEMGGSRVGLARLVATDARVNAAYTALFGPPPDAADARRFPPHAKPDPWAPGDEGAREPSAAAKAWLAMDAQDRRAIDTLAANAGKAIAAYERRLTSRGSPFDRYLDALKKDDAAAEAEYPETAQRGLALFLGQAGCRSCHGGPFFTDGEFHNIGVPALDKTPPKDPGRFLGIERLRNDPFNAHGAFSDDREGERAQRIGALAQPPESWATFRTPSLRNVARTAPYMHQGQFAALKDVLHYYSTLEGTVPVGHHGETVIRALNLTEEQQADLVAFLETLSDPPLPAELTTAPRSPLLEPERAKR